MNWHKGFRRLSITLSAVLPALASVIAFLCIAPELRELRAGLKDGLFEFDWRNAPFVEPVSADAEQENQEAINAAVLRISQIQDRRFKLWTVVIAAGLSAFLLVWVFYGAGVWVKRGFAG